MGFKIEMFAIPNMKAIIDPVDDILYMSFYVYGLEKMLGKNNVYFSMRPFADLSLQSRHSKSIRFVIDCDGAQKKYVIDGNDSFQIHEELYNWCDVYGSVNTNYGKVSEKYHGKLVALCPSFGVRCWSYPQIISHAFRNFHDPISTFKKWMGKHKRLMQRPEYEEYLSSSKQDDSYSQYVFFISTLWYNDEWNKNDDGVNSRRATFIRACKSVEGLVFEGGLVSQGKERSSEGLFADCLSKAVPMKEWLEKTRRSALVFNTPAFWDCHGWKLGEFLALGKCIVSTKLSNDLPAPMEHGKNIHFVENSQESMRDAVEYILTHSDYRKTLENGARAYWEQYGSPIASLKLLGIER